MSVFNYSFFFALKSYFLFCWLQQGSRFKLKGWDSVTDRFPDFTCKNGITFWILRLYNHLCKCLLIYIYLSLTKKSNCTWSFISVDL